MLSYYLDYYPGYRDESTMKVIRHESLGIYVYANEGFGEFAGFSAAWGYRSTHVRL